ncbi:MAG: undecaprenyl-diphosphate phosphatase [Eubacteriaceae bacterium]
MNTITSIILGIVQGLTEFLPISSSGHLVIFQYFFNVTEGNLAYDVLLHLGTLIAIIIAFWKSILNMVIEFFSMCKDFFTSGSFKIHKSKYRKYILSIILASIPVGIIGILFADIFETLFSNIQVVSFTLIITGIILMLGEKIGKKNTKSIEQLSIKETFIIGFFQAFAIVPGISRSGSTIVGGLMSGLEKQEATEFSFLVSLPAVLGAVLLKSKDIMELESLGISPITLFSGFFASIIFGILAIKLLVELVKKGKLHYFSYYCWAMSIILITYNLFIK